MHYRFLLVLSFILIIFVQLTYAQEFSQFVLNGNGARAAGMGYAFTGLSDDATAISWNSAGLTQLYSPEASVIARFGWGSTTPEYSDPSYTVDVTSGSSLQLNFASFAIPFSAGNINVVGGVAYRRVYDFTMKSTAKIGIPEFDYEAELEVDNSGGVDAITPAIGVQFNEMISAGVAVNIYTGATDYKESYTENQDVLGEYESSSSENYSGVGFDIGVLVKASPKFQLGANFGLPTTLEITGKREGYDDVESELKTPFVFSIGAAFRASDNITLAADFRSRPWKNAKIDDEELSDFVENANSIHLGLEYLAQAGKSVIPLRIGYYTLPTPGKDDKDDQITYNAITAGLGLILDTVILDGAFEYVFGSYVLNADEDTNANVSEFKITIGGTIHFGKN